MDVNSIWYGILSMMSAFLWLAPPLEEWGIEVLPGCFKWKKQIE